MPMNSCIRCLGKVRDYSCVNPDCMNSGARPLRATEESNVVHDTVNTVTDWITQSQPQRVRSPAVRAMEQKLAEQDAQVKALQSRGLLHGVTPELDVCWVHNQMRVNFNRSINESERQLLYRLMCYAIQAYADLQDITVNDESPQ